jgi:hypothetical protein
MKKKVVTGTFRILKTTNFMVCSDDDAFRINVNSIKLRGKSDKFLLQV